MLPLLFMADMPFDFVSAASGSEKFQGPAAVIVVCVSEMLFSHLRVIFFFPEISSDILFDAANQLFLIHTPIAEKIRLHVNIASVRLLI